MRPILLVWTALGALALTVPVGAGPLTLMPAPKHMRQAEGSVNLTEPSLRITGEHDVRVEYALEVLGDAWGQARLPRTGPRASIHLNVTGTPTDLQAAAAALALPPPPAERAAEAFVLDVGLTDPQRVSITASPAGAIYAAYTLAQVRACTEPGTGLPRLAISDWPKLVTRGHTGCPRDVSAKSLETLDWMARWRLNAIYYEIYGDQGQDSVPDVVADVQRECARRGILLYGLISNWRTELLLKRELCPSRQEDLAHIRRYATELLDRGCDGLIFLFDDITREAATHGEHCDLCRGRYSDLGAVQLALLQPMLDVARERQVTRLIVCPTPYFEGWQTYYGGLDGLAYFRTWGAAPQLAGVQQYFCQLRRPEIEAVRRAGLRNFVYWYNGLYEYASQAPATVQALDLWGGFSQLAWGWYVSRWDPQRGVVPRDDTVAAFRALPRLTDHAWLCGGGDWNFALWGCYCWDAARYEPEQYEAALLAALFGPQAAAAYGRWRDEIRPWLARLGGRSLPGSDEARQALTEDLLGSAQAAEAAVRDFCASALKGAVAGVAPAAMRQATADRLEQAVARLNALSVAARTRRTNAEVGPVTEALSGQATVREQKLKLGDFWTTFQLRYSQTREADGSVHRTQWHFGSGLGMTGPSYRNWYDAGFIDVLLDDQSLDSATPSFEVVEGASGQDLVGTWPTTRGQVTLRFSLLEGGLRIDGELAPVGEPSVTVQLFAIPSAGFGDWADMNKYTVTEAGEAAHGTPLDLPAGADWLFLGDRTYDVPHERAEGPCAVLFGSPLPTIHSDGGSYVVQVDARYPAGTRRFSLVLWDFNGLSNADGLAELQRRLPAARAALAAR